MKIKYIIVFLILLYGCVPSAFISSISKKSIEKNSTVYVSKLDSMSTEETLFREKLNAALKRKGYFSVNNFQKSKYYLFFDFNNPLNKNLNHKKNTNIFSIELFLIESKNIIDSSGLPFDMFDALWVCKIELTWLEFLKYQDDLIEDILKNFCRTYYNRRMFF